MLRIGLIFFFLLNNIQVFFLTFPRLSDLFPGYLCSCHIFEVVSCKCIFCLYKENFPFVSVASLCAKVVSLLVIWFCFD